MFCGIHTISSYVFFHLGDPYGLFHINNKTGVITVEGDIDRESYVNIELNITAYEVPQPESSATIKFKITFLDENDNKPKFDKESYLVKVEKQNLNAGTILTKSIKATDEDATVRHVVATDDLSNSLIFVTFFIENLELNTRQKFTNTFFPFLSTVPKFSPF